MFSKDFWQCNQKKIVLAEQNFSLLGGHFGHLSNNILYTRPVQRTHKKSVKLFNINVLFLFDLTLDFNKIVYILGYLRIRFFTV